MNPNLITDDEFSVYDHPLLQRDYIVSENDGNSTATPSERHRAIIQIENVRCAGCCAKIEQTVSAIAGVQGAEINYTTHQMQLDWNSSEIAFSAILRRLNEIGYPAHPVNSVTSSSSFRKQRNALIRQVGVAGALGMQIMVLSVCLYAGDWWGMEPTMMAVFKHLSLILVLPILAYSAWPFLSGAIRDLRQLRVGMDVPIAVGISIAFIASVYAVFFSGEDIYFDSIAMFVFLILGARLIELNYRLRALSTLDQYDAVLPASTLRLTDSGEQERVATVALTVGDKLLIEAGEVVPADGLIYSGRSSFDESLMTGESLPVVRSVGESVVAGSVNIEEPVQMRVAKVGDQTVLSAIAQLVQKAQFEKPSVSLTVERLASWFVVTVLTIAALVALAGFLSGSERWLTSTIAVLIVSCPCALALATPAALSMAMGQALKHGMMVGNSAALESLDRVNHFFFDKTGTLTTGVFEVCDIDASGQLDQTQAITIARSLEQHSNHPVAEALKLLPSQPLLPINELQRQAGGGLSGTIDGQRYFIGSTQFIAEQTGHIIQSHERSDYTLTVLANSDEILCVFSLKDQLRPGAKALINSLLEGNKAVTIISGDREAAVAAVARDLGISTYRAECSPEDKLTTVKQAADRGEITAMLGDGINDAPVVGAVHVSIAIGDRVNLTAMNADIVALNSSLGAMESLIRLSRQLGITIRQNLTWALGYNAVAIPFAALGLVPPWLAAIGMSTSSLIVVLNAARLGRQHKSNDSVSPSVASVSDQVILAPDT